MLRRLAPPEFARLSDKELSAHLYVHAVGSYARGRLACNDADVILINTAGVAPRRLLAGVVGECWGERLGGTYLSKQLESNDVPGAADWMGYCRRSPYRSNREFNEWFRIDLFARPVESAVPALMQLTSGASFFIALRVWAARPPPDAVGLAKRLSSGLANGFYLCARGSGVWPARYEENEYITPVRTYGNPLPLENEAALFALVFLPFVPRHLRDLL